MNLWIVLAITWISVSVVIADSSWFVQDTPLPGDDSDAQLFSSEYLIRVDKKPLPAASKPVKKEPPRPPAQSRTVKEGDKAGLEKDLPDVSEVKKEGLLLVDNPTGRKPLQAGNTAPTRKTPELSKEKTTSGVFKDTEWFVPDVSEEVEGSDGLFPSENLIRLYNEKKKAPARQVSGLTQQTVKSKPVNTVKKTIKSQKKDDNDDNIDSKGYFPLTQAVSKSVETAYLTLQSKGRTALEMTELHSKPAQPGSNLLKASHNIDSWFVMSTPATVDAARGDFSEEQFILVSKINKQTKSTEELANKKPVQDKRATDTQRDTNAPNQPNNKLLKSLPEDAMLEGKAVVDSTGRKPLQILQRDPEPAVGEQKVDEMAGSPCDREKDVDCLMADEDLILVKKSNQRSEPKPLINQLDQTKNPQESKPEHGEVKEKEVNRESLHRRLMENNQEALRRERRAAVYPGESEEIEIGDSELEWTDTDQTDDTPLRRVPRQATEESGDGGFDGETEIQNSNHILNFRTTMNTTLQNMTEEVKENITLEFARQMLTAYQNYSAFQGIIVRNVSLDDNQRVVFSWDLVLSTSAAPGNTKQERVQNSLAFVNDTVIPFINNDLNIRGQPVHEEVDPTIQLEIAAGLLSDECQAQDACPDGYACISAESICRHLCYHNSFNEQCRHGSTCQLDQQYQPYCQCGSGYTGEFCQTAMSESQYTTEQVVGAGVSGAVVVTGVACTLFYLAFLRKKKESDMEYSYFGDDDSPMAAYSDPDSNLGINGFSIARPSIALQPGGMYHDLALP